MVGVQDGDIVLSREPTFSSWVIRKATSSDWSHAGIIYSEGYFVSAVPLKGVCIQPTSIISTYSVYRLKGINATQRAMLKGFADLNLGRPYDFIQVALLGWRILTNTLGVCGSDPNPAKFECLEFVSEAFNFIEVRFGKFVDNLLPNTIVNSPLLERIV